MDQEAESEAEAEAGGRARTLLTFEEARVLGCLLEKEATTPDYYPMTLNALLNACNQKSNREPVTGLDSASVETALFGLREKHFAARVAEAGARATKYRHTVDQAIAGIQKGEQALLCVMLLRGAQSVGELRGRSERIHLFFDLAAVETCLDGMMHNFPSPVVACLPPGGGRKVSTYTHLLCGDVEIPETTMAAPSPASAPLPAREAEEPSWREELQDELAGLKRELDDLKEAFERFKEQFG